MDKLNLRNLTKDQIKLYAAILYWCEGSKYPSSTTLNFTTSDLKMQKLFISLLRKGFEIKETKFRIWLQFHSDQNEKDLYKYWSKNLIIPTNQFMKPRITNKNGTRYRRIYYGTCSLRYADYSLILRLMGIYKQFYKQAIIELI